MPRGDRSGPSSDGPSTGRGMGYCTGNDHPGFMNQYVNRARGFGRRFRGSQAYGRGAGFGFRHGLENEIRILKDQMTALEKRLSNTKDK